jgi:hypothetical protein
MLISDAIGARNFILPNYFFKNLFVLSTLCSQKKKEKKKEPVGAVGILKE